MRRRARVDSNQSAIVKALRKIPGVSVEPGLSRLGKGVPDLLVGYRGYNHLFELKDGAKTTSRRKLTEDESQWHDKWCGSVHTVKNLDEMLLILGIVTGVGR